ncbi:MAG TPA: DUF3107 domain-containing protein [Acidimicrobiia bacterium]|jgi:hypothetical protein|nr:DUF3107 domain-containing protein [Acidimicrobiia bacterium]
MEVRIGVVYTTRELTIETAEEVDAVTQAVERAFAGTGGVLWLTDTKGRRVGVPTDKVAYVEIAADAGGRKVGFGSSGW